MLNSVHCPNEIPPPHPDTFSQKYLIYNYFWKERERIFYAAKKAHAINSYSSQMFAQLLLASLSFYIAQICIS